MPLQQVKVGYPKCHQTDPKLYLPNEMTIGLDSMIIYFDHMQAKVIG